MNIATSVTSKKLSESEYFSLLVNHAIENNFSIALWRLPNEDMKHAILSQHHQNIKKDSPIEELPTGFIFAPFNKDKDRLFLKADFSFSFFAGEPVIPQSPLEIDSLAWFNEQLRNSSTVTSIRQTRTWPTATQPDESNYINLVKKSISEIEKNTFEKVVPSRFKEINLPDGFDVSKTFIKLCNAYPNALISFISLPGIGNWLGASPELLVSVEDKTIFKTIALAGTKPYSDNLSIKKVAWTQKEIEEQALVERYIISCFKKIRLREYDEHGPKTVVAGNLMHLRSDFTVDIKATNFPQLGSVMLGLLHPTSAVCGMPLETAHTFLTENEGYDREFYAGFLGPVNFNNSINIYVNIRCLQLIGHRAICYAGAGVTVDSIPEEEWIETEMKLNTLLKVIL